MMKKVSLFLVFFAALSFALVSCGGETPKAAEDEATDDVEVTTPEVDVETPAAEVMDLSAGEALYTSKMCITCHQANGEGMEGAFPPLVQSDYLMEDVGRAIRQARLGSNGLMTVNGVEYNGTMPPAEITDEELVDLMNYVLNSWGNAYGMITIDDVTAAFAE